MLRALRHHHLHPPPLGGIRQSTERADLLQCALRTTLQLTHPRGYATDAKNQEKKPKPPPSTATETEAKDTQTAISSSPGDDNPTATLPTESLPPTDAEATETDETSEPPPTTLPAHGSYLPGRLRDGPVLPPPPGAILSAALLPDAAPKDTQLSLFQKAVEKLRDSRRTPRPDKFWYFNYQPDAEVAAASKGPLPAVTTPSKFTYNAPPPPPTPPQPAVTTPSKFTYNADATTAASNALWLRRHDAQPPLPPDPSVAPPPKDLTYTSDESDSAPKTTEAPRPGSTYDAAATATSKAPLVQRVAVERDSAQPPTPLSRTVARPPKFTNQPDAAAPTASKAAMAPCPLKPTVEKTPTDLTPRPTNVPRLKVFTYNPDARAPPPPPPMVPSVPQPKDVTCISEPSATTTATSKKARVVKGKRDVTHDSEPAATTTAASKKARPAATTTAAPKAPRARRATARPVPKPTPATIFRFTSYAELAASKKAGLVINEHVWRPRLPPEDVVTTGRVHVPRAKKPWGFGLDHNVTHNSEPAATKPAPPPPMVVWTPPCPRIESKPCVPQPKDVTHDSEPAATTTAASKKARVVEGKRVRRPRLPPPDVTHNSEPAATTTTVSKRARPFKGVRVWRPRLPPEDVVTTGSVIHARAKTTREHVFELLHDVAHHVWRPRLPPEDVTHNSEPAATKTAPPPPPRPAKAPRPKFFTYNADAATASSEALWSKRDDRKLPAPPPNPAGLRPPGFPYNAAAATAWTKAIWSTRDGSQTPQPPSPPPSQPTVAPPPKLTGHLDVSSSTASSQAPLTTPPPSPQPAEAPRPTVFTYNADAATASSEALWFRRDDSQPPQPPSPPPSQLTVAPSPKLTDHPDAASTAASSEAPLITQPPAPQPAEAPRPTVFTYNADAATASSEALWFRRDDTQLPAPPPKPAGPRPPGFPYNAAAATAWTKAVWFRPDDTQPATLPSQPTDATHRQGAAPFKGFLRRLDAQPLRPKSTYRPATPKPSVVSTLPQQVINISDAATTASKEPLVSHDDTPPQSPVAPPGELTYNTNDAATAASNDPQDLGVNTLPQSYVAPPPMFTFNPDAATASPNALWFRHDDAPSQATVVRTPPRPPIKRIAQPNLLQQALLSSNVDPATLPAPVKVAPVVRRPIPVDGADAPPSNVSRRLTPPPKKLRFYGDPDPADEPEGGLLRAALKSSGFEVDGCVPPPPPLPPLRRGETLEDMQERVLRAKLGAMQEAGEAGESASATEKRRFFGSGCGEGGWSR
ncbi:hypothetical protein EDC01DRAFT_640024 [Geopyxis carbonaria]|nr:hypothetical protein EDC01DRAFT_640024 [Geopyxis carbonaria]